MRRRIDKKHIHRFIGISQIPGTAGKADIPADERILIDNLAYAKISPPVLAVTVEYVRVSPVSVCLNLSVISIGLAVNIRVRIMIEYRMGIAIGVT